MIRGRVGFLYLYLTGIVTPTEVGSTDICGIQEDGANLQVDCSWRNIKNITSDFQTNIMELNLAHNFIGDVKENVLKNLKSVIRLDLSHNNISSIAARAFDGMSSLSYLNLESNRLEYVSEIFRPEIFIGLEQLRVLLLNNNNKNVSSLLKYPSTSLKFLTELEELHMDGILNTTLDIGFLSLRNLSTLVFSGRNGVCNMGHIEATFFEHTPHLRYIDMSYCNITSIQNDAFECLKNIVGLDLSANTNIALRDFEAFSKGLSKAPLRFLYLNKIGNEVSSCNSLRVSHFSALNSSNLEVLELEDNNIRFLEKYLISEYLPKSLKRVSLRNNILPYGDHITEFVGLPNLEEVDLGGNLLSECSYIGFQSVRRLSLTDNHCYKFYADYFTSHYALKELDLSNNFLGETFSQDVDGNFFKPLTNITRLELRNNHIDTLHSSSFQFLSMLQVLDVSRNMISEWTLETKYIKNMSIVNISHNFLKDLPERFRLDLDRWGNNLSIFLSSNQLQCTCNTKEFCRWMRDSRAIIKDYHKVNVYVANGSVFPFHKLDDILLNLQSGCALDQNEAYVLVLTGLTLGIAVLLLVVVVVYRMRWWLRFNYFRFRYKYATVPSEPKYDAFISYSNNDSKFVHHLVSSLEQEQDLFLCVHQRDFLPGVMISENIIDAIQSSQFTILILSPSFLESEWCNFELNAAIINAYGRHGSSSLIFVLLGISKHKLPRNARPFLDRYTYMYLPVDDVDCDNIDSNFVKKLKIALMKKRKRAETVF